MAKIVLAKDLSGSQGEMFLAASSKEAQQQFFGLVGLCEKDVYAIPETETDLSDEEALLMATALQHEPREMVTCLGFEHSDQYFTDDEFQKYVGKLLAVHAPMYESVRNKQLPSDTSITMYNAALRATCGCVAHASDLMWVKELIDVESPVNEYSGGIIATHLLQRILGSIKGNVTIEKCSQGSPFSVAYAIQTADMKETVKFSGWPDHTFLSSPVDTHQRISKCNRLVGVGETPSPPGRSLQALSAAIGQAGIAALGNLIKKPGPGGKLVVVVLSKVKTVMVLLMKLHDDILSFKFAESVAGFDLKDVNSLKQFASVLKKSLQWQAE